MKNIIIAIVLLPLLVACHQKELKQLKEKNRKLEQMANEKDATINEFVESIDMIATNLKMIKEKEQIIAVNARENPSQNKKVQIVSDLRLVQNLLDLNNAKLKKLDEHLKNSWYQNAKMKKLVAKLKVEMKQKDLAIGELSKKISRLDIEVDNLNNQLSELNGTVLALNSDNKNKEEIIKSQIDSLNTAYFVVGNKKELIKKEVINKTGGLLGIGASCKLNQHINTENLSKIDITKITRIPIGAKKITFVNARPANSYQLERSEDKKIKTLKILKPKEFWKSSKYLVITTN